MRSSAKITTLQIVFVGGQAIGKTCLIKTYCDGQFDSNSVATVGIEMSEKIIEMSNNKIKLRIIEGKNPPSPMFKNVKPFFNFETTKAIILMCDLSDEAAAATYQDEVLACLEEMNHSNSNLFKVIVGCKADLAIDDNEKKLKGIAIEHGCYYKSVSAKTGRGVDKLFNKIVEEILKIPPPSLVKSSFIASMTENQTNGEKDQLIKETSKPYILS